MPVIREKRTNALLYNKAKCGGHEAIGFETDAYYGNDFVFVPGADQESVAQTILQLYCAEIAHQGDKGIENVQILSPFKSEGAASTAVLNAAIRERLNPYRSAEEEIKVGPKQFRVGDRVMQTKNTQKVSNGDLGFIRFIRQKPNGEKIVGLEFGAQKLEYGPEEMTHLELAYAVTVHKALGSEYGTIIMPLVKAHTVLLYRNLLYTAVTRAKQKVILVGEKAVLFMAIHRCNSNKRNTLLGERIVLYHKALAASPKLPPVAGKGELKEELEQELKQELKKVG